MRYVLLLCVLGWVGCGRSSSSPAPEASVTVAGTIRPMAMVLERVLPEEGYQVVALLPDGVSPHGFEATASTRAAGERAAMVVGVGMGLDPWVTGHGKVVNMADLLGLAVSEPVEPGQPGAEPHVHPVPHEHDEDCLHADNAHLWVDPVLMAEFVEKLVPLLSEAFPGDADAIRQRAAIFIAELGRLDEDVRAQLETLSRRELVTFHNAIDPLAERYGLRVVAHLVDVELAPGGEVRPHDLAQAISAVQTHDLPVIYAEPQFPKDATTAIREATGVRVLTIDPLGRAGMSYVDLIRGIASAIVEGDRVEP